MARTPSRGPGRGVVPQYPSRTTAKTHRVAAPGATRNRTSSSKVALGEGPSVGHVYLADFLGEMESRDLLVWLTTPAPLWEHRFVQSPPRSRRTGVEQSNATLVSGEEAATSRMLLRPVYWLGSWQFACLDYYRPPRGAEGRCVHAEPFPSLMRALVDRIEAAVRSRIALSDIPPRWHLNVCLINYYGERHEGGQWRDAGRVGEHRDEEPGPVASISLGARALLQFVTRTPRGVPSQVVTTQWLDHNGLQIFAGQRYKRELLHRVTRVDRRLPADALGAADGIHAEPSLGPQIPDFRTRRINLTFRYVPDEHVGHVHELKAASLVEVLPYVRTLAQSSSFWRDQLAVITAHQTPLYRP